MQLIILEVNIFIAVEHDIHCLYINASSVINVTTLPDHLIIYSFIVCFVYYYKKNIFEAWCISKIYHFVNYEYHFKQYHT